MFLNGQKMTCMLPHVQKVQKQVVDHWKKHFWKLTFDFMGTIFEWPKDDMYAASCAESSKASGGSLEKTFFES